jgi:hypothetical protein
LNTSEKYLDISSERVSRLNLKKRDGLELIHFGIQVKYRTLFKLLVIGFLGFTGAGIILFLTSRYGAGLTPDSAAYISAARNLAEGNGFLTYNGLHLVVQPPLYSIILAVIKNITSVDPQMAAGYLNAFLFGLIINLSGLLLLRYLKSFVLILLGTVSVLISYALVQASLMALSELLFIFLLLLFLYSFGTYQAKRDFISFFVFSISAALACLTRYTGIVMILLGVLSIFFLTRNTKKEIFWHAVIFLLISVLPISVWVIRNYFISGTLVGLRAASSYTLLENFTFFYNTVSPWYLPFNSIVISFILIFLVFAIWILFKSSKQKSWNRDVINLIGPSLMFVVLYSAVILVSSTTTAYDKISDRLLSPIYIPVIFTLFFITDKILRRLVEITRLKSITLFFVIGITLLMSYPATNTMQIAEQYIDQAGWGFNSDLWRKSETLEYLNRQKQLGKSFTFYSNEPEAVYLQTNLTTKCSPAKTFYNSPQLFSIKENLKQGWLNGENVCLVWFNNSNRNYLFTIDELQKNIKMNEIASLKDGKIYTFSIR